MCEQSTQVHRYHDGYLTAQADEEVETHLRDCPECAALLADLRGLSRLIAAAPRAQISADAMARLRNARSVVRDRGVMRIASWLTAAAAGVALATLLIKPAEPQMAPGATASAAVWQTRAVMPPGQVGDGGAGELGVMARGRAH